MLELVDIEKSYQKYNDNIFGLLKKIKNLKYNIENKAKMFEQDLSSDQLKEVSESIFNDTYEIKIIQSIIQKRNQYGIIDYKGEKHQISHLIKSVELAQMNLKILNSINEKHQNNIYISMKIIETEKEIHSLYKAIDKFNMQSEYKIN